jgi:serine/threonine protein kinase
VTQFDRKPPTNNLQPTLQEQLPELGGELEVAINALKRVQIITGVLQEDRASAMVEPGQRTAAFAETLEPTPFPNLSEKDDTDRAGAPGPSRQQILASGQTFGRYQISRLLGRGAMGAVYLAYDPQLQRYVALKTPFLTDRPTVVQRFYREARSAAQIRSPYVCPIYEVNSVAGKPYLTMAFIEGKPLTKWIRQDPPHSLEDILSMFHKIALGMHKAHAHSVIHRDLKPDNIMVDPESVPIIMYFGLARRVDDDEQMTIAGSIAGTPAYMSPEQVRGQLDEIGPPSDIYSLGVVLYEMLTGVIPFRGPIASVLQRVLNEQPPAPSSVQPKLPADSPIESICLRMMAKSIADRYASMSEVLAELSPLVERGSAPTPLPSKPSRLGFFQKLFRRAALDATP